MQTGTARSRLVHTVPPYQNSFPEHERRKRPPGMTTEQLDYFTEQTVRAVERGTKKGVQHYRNNAIIGFIILALGIGYIQWDHSNHTKESREAIVKSGRAVALLGCNRDYNTQNALRGVLTASKEFARTAARRGNITGADLQERLAFYDRQLERIEVPDCRTARSVVTDDPRDVGELPAPLYPGHPGEDDDELQPGIP
jgi:hypothetical protein